MAKPRPEPKKKTTDAVPDGGKKAEPELSAAEALKMKGWLIFAQAFATLAERFGLSFATLLLVVGVIWMFGDNELRQNFLKEALFGAVTGHRYLSIFMGILVLNAGVNFAGIFRWFREDSKEVRRLTAERDRLQEKLLGVHLHHTDPGNHEGKPGTPVLSGGKATS